VISSAAGQKFRNVSPTVAKPRVCHGYNFPFFGGESVLLNRWVQLVAPPFAALLGKAPPKVGSDEAPIFGAVLLHQLNKLVVLLKHRFELIKAEDIHMVAVAQPKTTGHGTRDRGCRPQLFKPNQLAAPGDNG
jgi:hypothetical protein